MQVDLLVEKFRLVDRHVDGISLLLANGSDVTEIGHERETLPP
jgi:hypothetical protein